MLTRTRLVAVVAAFAVAALTAAAVQAATEQKVVQQKGVAAAKQDQPKEQWRYTFHNGEWWYWLPTNRWVFWRGSRWNAYDPTTYASPTYTYPAYNGVMADGRGGWVYANGGVSTSANRPFYGHAVSGWDWRPVQPNEENRPFYGHALPSEFFGSWGSRWSNRPFYGHAVSYYGY